MAWLLGDDSDDAFPRASVAGKATSAFCLARTFADGAALKRFVHAYGPFAATDGADHPAIRRRVPATFAKDAPADGLW